MAGPLCALNQGIGANRRNPVTGADHRVLINLPQGFEYTVAEVGRDWAKTSGAIALNLEDSHAHFAHLHMTQSGVVR